MPGQQTLCGLQGRGEEASTASYLCLPASDLKVGLQASSPPVLGGPGAGRGQRPSVAGIFSRSADRCPASGLPHQSYRQVAFLSTGWVGPVLCNVGTGNIWWWSAMLVFHNPTPETALSWNECPFVWFGSAAKVVSQYTVSTRKPVSTIVPWCRCTWVYQAARSVMVWSSTDHCVNSSYLSWCRVCRSCS